VAKWWKGGGKVVEGGVFIRHPGCKNSQNGGDGLSARGGSGGETTLGEASKRAMLKE